MKAKLAGPFAIVLLLAGCGESQQDYLSPALRDQVEQLKTDVERTPTDDATASARARVLFDWLNAWAMAGGYVPVNAPAVVSQINAYGVPAGPVLDMYVAEMRLHDERPEAIGTLHLEQPGPFKVREYGTFSQTYTVGEAPVEDGGGFLVAKHFQANHPPFQTDDPSGANYVSISSDNRDVRFTVDSYDVPGMHGGFRGAAPQLVFRVRDGSLDTGDQVEITYGDTSAGGPGLLMPDFVSDQMPFPVYVDLDGSDLWLSLPIQPVEVIGTDVDAVAGFAPSLVDVGEGFEVSIRAADKYGNKATGNVPDWRIYDGDRLLREVASNGSAIVVVPDLELAPGVHRLTIVSKDDRIEGAVNPVLVAADPPYRIYWGDTHGHSGFAEGIGSAEAYMEFARDQARLDFITHSEHDIWMDDREWETLRELVTRYTQEGRFVAYLGYEWTVRQSNGGHHNVLFRTPEGRDRVPSQFYGTLSRLYQGLRERYDTDDVLIIPHAHQKADYRFSDPEMETLVEIMSMHGTFEWFGRMYLNHGHEVGFVAASDDHIGRPGYAQPRSFSLAQRNGLGAVLARERTTDAIFDAMKQLSAYATTGQRIILDVNVNGARMGQRAEYSTQRTVSGRVIGTAPIESITLFKNDDVLEEWHYVDAGDDEIVLTFFSESYPYHPEDNPRGWRHWRGQLQVDGATVHDATLVDFQNLESQKLVRHGNRIEFATHTRGDHSSIRLKLAHRPEAAVSITVDLEEARETGSGPPRLRRHQSIEGRVVELSLAPGQSATTEDVGVDGYRDTISLRRGGEMPSDVLFQHIDRDNPRHGDYYFVRVRQADEGLAWSSPVWVGGSPPR